MLYVPLFKSFRFFFQVQQYKHERECNAVIAQTLEGKIARLESLMDGTLPTEEFMNEEFLSLMNEHKVA
jgi:kinesin family protein 15